MFKSYYKMAGSYVLKRRYLIAGQIVDLNVLANKIGRTEVAMHTISNRS